MQFKVSIARNGGAGKWLLWWELGGLEYNDQGSRERSPSLCGFPKQQSGLGQLNPSQGFTRPSTSRSWIGVSTARRRMSLTAGIV